MLKSQPELSKRKKKIKLIGSAACIIIPSARLVRVSRPECGAERGRVSPSRDVMWRLPPAALCRAVSCAALYPRGSPLGPGRQQSCGVAAALKSWETPASWDGCHPAAPVTSPLRGLGVRLAGACVLLPAFVRGNMKRRLPPQKPCGWHGDREAHLPQVLCRAADEAGGVGWRLWLQYLLCSAAGKGAGPHVPVGGLCLQCEASRTGSLADVALLKPARPWEYGTAAELPWSFCFLSGASGHSDCMSKPRSLKYFTPWDYEYTGERCCF